MPIAIAVALLLNWQPATATGNPKPISRARGGARQVSSPTLLPGSSVGPIPFDTVAPSASNLLATNINANYGFFDADHRINFVTLREAVYRDQASGGLDFYFVAGNSASSTDNVGNISFTGFAGYVTGVYIYPSVLPEFGQCCANLPPAASRDATGANVAFTQAPLTINRDSYTMEIRTNAGQFDFGGAATFDVVNFAGGAEGSQVIPSYEPAPLAVACPPGCASFASTAGMSAPRQSQAAVRLNNGQVLVAGSDSFDRSSDLYNPETGVFTPTGSLNVGRCYGCASTLLPDGTVLVAGGWNGGPVLASAELYNPATGAFGFSQGSMTTGRLGPSATVLRNGKVLIAFGHDGSNAIGSAELYDPSTQTFTLTGPPMAARLPSSAMLQDGRVLFAGGQAPGGSFLASAEIYDPQTEAFSFTGSLNAPRHGADATTLLDGRVLLSGGLSDNQTVTSTAEIYSPITGSFAPTGAMTTPRNGHAAVLLADGKVLVLGGTDATGHVLASAELFDPNSGTFTPTASLTTARSSPSATVLADGRILVAGGNAQGGALLGSAELYDCVTTITPVLTWSPAPLAYGTPLGTAQLDATSTTAGTFSYDPPAGTMLPAGPRMLTTFFTPTDTSHFGPATTSVLLTVSPAPLTVKAKDAAVMAGAPLPAFAVNYATFVGSDGPSALSGTLTFATAASSASAPGTYPVTPAGVTSTNYAITFSPGTLTISYGVSVLFDQTKAVKSGATLPIKIQLVDANGNDLSASAVTVSAVSITQVSTSASADVVDAGAANPDSDFRFDVTLGPTGGYIFNLKTTGLATGTYALSFSAGSDPTQHQIVFQVR